MKKIRFEALKRHQDLGYVCALISSKIELQLVGPHGEFPLTPSRFQETLKTRSLPTVGLLDNDIVAFACLTDLVLNQNAFIGNLIVSKKQRGKGIGKKLIEHLVSASFSSYNLIELNILVYQSNTTALKLYNSIGFRQTTKQSQAKNEGLPLVELNLIKSDYYSYIK